MREAQVAGSFYPAEPAELREMVTALLERQPVPNATAPKPRIVIVPHAGYQYSGPVAARAFRDVQGRSYDGVVVVGFVHRAMFEGISIEDRDRYRTPLGEIPIDHKAVEFLEAFPRTEHVEGAHGGGEHSLDVMLPFLQVALGRFKLVPIVLGGVDAISAEGLADALAALSARGDYLFVFSTDLSHYHPYDEAMRRDEVTVNAILSETSAALARLIHLQRLEACGIGPIRAGVLLAERIGYPERRLLAYANSGDTAGDKDRVVGYAAIAMYDRPAVAGERISAEAGDALVRAARQTLDDYFSHGPDRIVSFEGYPELQQPRGLFVTLRKPGGELRGCIGRVEADLAPAALLPTIALESALNDPRFPPVKAEEVKALKVEVSLLTPPKPVASAKEIVVGRDGVVLMQGRNSGLFLPQVWYETGWTRLEFLRELSKQKAGLPQDAWQRAQLYTFQAHVFDEQ